MEDDRQLGDQEQHDTQENDDKRPRLANLDQPVQQIVPIDLGRRIRAAGSWRSAGRLVAVVVVAATAAGRAIARVVGVPGGL